ncbi:MAG: amidohydrolase family protein [Chitinophagaceae bacterium]|nr:amidohydrolase family protein [Chitinophagaceae bacterium]
MMKFTTIYRALFVLILPAVGPGCRTGDESYYSLEDYAATKKVDVHAHALTLAPDLPLQAKTDNFTLVSLNSEVPDYPPIDSQQYYILQLRQKVPGSLYYVSAFSTVGVNGPGWAEKQLDYLRKSFDSGALGIKVWKNIGMTIKNKDSQFIMIDDPVFDPIFNYLEQHDIPVIGHIGEPKNCWLPLDQMTTNNDRSYFTVHPEYHMFLHPEYPSYDTIIRSRDHLLEKHPRLRFIGAHLGSMEWSVDEIAKRLDKFPLMSVEPAERLGQIQYQSIQDWEKVRAFFIKYQDRIMYGTDIEDNNSLDHAAAARHAHELWLRDWRYLTSADSLESPYVNGKFKGLHLPKTVIDKIYYDNAQRWYFKK